MARVFDRITADRGHPVVFRLDSGPESISLALTEWVEKYTIKLELTQPGKPMRNVFIECSNRIYRIEILDFYPFGTLSEVREIAEKWLSKHNCERPYESLNNITPEEYRQRHYLTGIPKSVWN